MHFSTKGWVTTYVDASPEVVYDIVSDVTRMGEWSPQTYRCEWVRGASRPVVGARFQARNRRGWLRWSNQPEVIFAEPGRQFAFKRQAMGGEVIWRYELQPSADGTDVTESYEITKPSPTPVVWLFTKLAGIEDIDADLRENLRSSLAGLATVAARTSSSLEA